MAEQINNDTTVTEVPVGFKKGDFKSMEMFKKAKQHADSVQGVIIQLQKDSLVLAKDVNVLKAETTSLHIKIDQLQADKDTLKSQLEQARINESPIACLTNPPGCYVLIVLIIAITVIVLKRGFSFAKGDTKVSLGGESDKK